MHRDDRIGALCCALFLALLIAVLALALIDALAPGR